MREIRKIMFPYGQHLNFVEVAFLQKFMIFCIFEVPTMADNGGGCIEMGCFT